MKLPYDVLCFDLWDTLIFRPWQENLYQTLAQRIPCDLDRVIELARFTWFRGLKHDKLTFARDLSAILVSQTSPGTSQAKIAEKIEETITQYELAEGNPQWVPGAKEFMSWVNETGIPSVIVSNSSPNTRRLLDQSWLKTELLPLVDEVILSCEAGYLKPDPRLVLQSRIVREAIASGNRRCCLIGDKFDTDILMAQVLGIDSILIRYGSNNESGVWEKCRPRIAKVNSFAQIETLVRIDSVT